VGRSRPDRAQLSSASTRTVWPSGFLGGRLSRSQINKTFAGLWMAERAATWLLLNDFHSPHFRFRCQFRFRIRFRFGCNPRKYSALWGGHEFQLFPFNFARILLIRSVCRRRPPMTTRFFSREPSSHARKHSDSFMVTAAACPLLCLCARRMRMPD